MTTGVTQTLEGEMTSERKHDGLAFDEHVIEEAWRVLCPAGKDVLTRSDVLRTWRVFDPSVTLDDVRVMVGPKGIELDDLINILKDKSPQGFDPVAEAFQYLDPEKSGFIDADILKRVLSQVATGPSCTQIDDDDIRLLIEALDTDDDGQISFEVSEEYFVFAAPKTWIAKFFICIYLIPIECPIV